MVFFALLWASALILSGHLDRQHGAGATAIPPGLVQKNRPCTAASFTDALPSYAAVERVDSVAANSSYGEGTADLGFPTNATGLPQLCALTVRVLNGSSRYRLGLFLPPASSWNGRFLAVGSYSFAGGIHWAEMGSGSHYGFASLSSDGGHNSTQDALDWKPTTPDQLLDWGYRSMHGSVELGKLLTSAYYEGTPIRYSYYSGCSTGGRQGLKEIQISPDSFDGVLVGAPAWWTSHLMPWLTRIGAANLPTSAAGHLDLPEFAILAAAALAQCDSLDGYNDTIISKPEECVINLEAVRCPGAGSTNGNGTCLTDAQIVTAQALYADALTAKGDLIYQGHTVGSEDQWYYYLTFGAPEDFDTRYERFWLYNDTHWNWTLYSDETFYDAVRINPSNATADAYNIQPYEGRGGKVLLYQGLADAVIPPRGTTYYYNRTVEAMSATTKMDAFFRYFQIPGMQHCFLTPPEVQAPWMFAAPGQATRLQEQNHFGAGWGVPGLPPSPEHDALLALVDWVEQDKAPDRIVATTWNTDGSVRRTRPICPFPREAVYRGGNMDAAASWVCQ